MDRFPQKRLNWRRFAILAIAGALIFSGACSSDSGSGSGQNNNSEKAANTQRVEDPSGTVSVEIPEGWSHQTEQEMLTISRPGQEVQIIVAPHYYSDLSQVRSEIQDVRDPASGTNLKAQVSDFGSKGLFWSLRGSTQGKDVVIETITLISPYKGGINIVANSEAAAYSEEVTSALRQIGESVAFLEPKSDNAANRTRQQLSGKQLLYLYTGNGYSEKIAIDLCSDGTFAFSSDNVSNSGLGTGATADSDAGAWSVERSGGDQVLLLRFQSGSVNEYQIEGNASGSEIRLNGRRYFVQQGERCR